MFGRRSLILSVAVICTVFAVSGLVAQSAEAIDVENALSASERTLLGHPESEPMEGARLKQRAEEVSAEMRCPVCQGLSVADSPTPAAVAMKGRVRGLLAAGYSEDQILRYFEASYGEFIRLAPKPVGFNLIAWLLPLVALVLAAAWLTLRARRGAGLAEEEDLSQYLEQVRREVE